MVVAVTFVCCLPMAVNAHAQVTLLLEKMGRPVNIMVSKTNRERSLKIQETSIFFTLSYKNVLLPPECVMHANHRLPQSIIQIFLLLLKI